MGRLSSSARRTIRRRAFAAAGGGVVAVASLTGCSDDSSSATSSTSRATSTTTSSTPTTSPTTSSKPSTSSTSPTSSDPNVAGAPGVPEAARHRTEAGAIAFTKYYLDQINTTGTHPRKGVLRALSIPTCKTCENLEASVDYAVDHSERNSGAQVKLVSIKGLMPNGETRTIEAITDQLAFSVIGPSPTSYPALKRAGYVFSLSWGTNGWRTKEIQIDRSAS